MSVDSAWIFRICLVMAVSLILFADFLGYGGANARKSDKSEDYEDYTADEQQIGFKTKQGSGNEFIDDRNGHAKCNTLFPRSISKSPHNRSVLCRENFEKVSVDVLQTKSYLVSLEIDIQNQIM